MGRKDSDSVGNAIAGMIICVGGGAVLASLAFGPLPVLAFVGALVSFGMAVGALSSPKGRRGRRRRRRR